MGAAKKVLILHDRVPPGAPEDCQDTLWQADAVSAALATLGYEAERLEFSLDFSAMAAALREKKPAFVFNLAESVEGSGRLIHLPPTVMDFLGIPYTGVTAEGQFLTSHKLFAKRMMADARLPTPPWITPENGTDIIPGERYIVKSRWEHASIGLDEDSVLTPASRKELVEEIHRREREWGGEFFAELFVEGREFNLAVLGGKEGPQVLPPAEILFVNYSPGKHRVVGYKAKWKEDSFEYNNTPRTFTFPKKDAALLRKLTDFARRTWSLFDLRGYCRVDFRVDRERRPWILEVNANPCLNPEGGFVSAVKQAGLNLEDAIGRIVQDSLRGREIP